MIRVAMPLDTSTYALSLLRLDGRRWNELRRISAQISTQAASDGSSYLEMGNTKVICTITGPAERKRGGGAGGGRDDEKASIEVEVGIAGFSGERKKRGKGDRRIVEIQSTISSAFSSTLFTQLYPRSTIHIAISILSLDGALLAACINAATLALIDAGVPMSDYIIACTSGTTTTTSMPIPDSENSTSDPSDPLLDLNASEEQELPWLTVATVGAGEMVSVLVLEKRVRPEWVEGMLAVGVDGCKQVREILDQVVRRHGHVVLQGAS